MDAQETLRRASKVFDLTSDTPPRSPTPVYERAASMDSPGPISPEPEQATEGGAIDLTSADEPIIIDDDSDVLQDSTTANPNAMEMDRQGGGSDRDSLFEGDEETNRRWEFNDIEESERSDIFALSTLQSLPSERPSSRLNTSTSNLPPPIFQPPQIKSGRKRALDVMEEQESSKSRPPPKKAKSIGIARTNSLFTAVGGKAVVRGREGAYQSFSAINSSGSKLAEKKRIFSSHEMPNASSSREVPPPEQPPMLPEELEDYEEDISEEVPVPV